MCFIKGIICTHQSGKGFIKESDGGIGVGGNLQDDDDDDIRAQIDYCEEQGDVEMAGAGDDGNMLKWVPL